MKNPCSKMVKKYNQCLWVSYAPLIKWEALYPRLSIFYGSPKPQHLARFYEKSPQSQKFQKIKGFEVVTMYLMACTLAHRY